MKRVSKGGLKAISGLLFLLAALSVGVQARADQSTSLFWVVSDAFPGSTYTLAVLTNDQGDFTGASYGASNYTLSDLAGGVVAFQKEGKNVIYLSITKSFSPKDGGEIIVSYLLNGAPLVPQRYGAFKVVLVRNGASWLPYTSENGQAGHPFTQMNIVPLYKTFPFVGRKLVGVDHIETN